MPIRPKVTALTVYGIGFVALAVAGLLGLGFEGADSPVAWITTLALLGMGGFLLSGAHRARTMDPRYVVLRRRAIRLPRGAPIWSSPDVELSLRELRGTEVRVRRGVRALELSGPLGDRYVIYGSWIGEERLRELEALIELRTEASFLRRSPVEDVAAEALAMEAGPRTIGVVVDTRRPARPRASCFLEDLEDYETLLARADFPLHDHAVVLADGVSERVREALDERLAAAREVVGFREAPR